MNCLLWQCLNKCRTAVAKALGVADLDLELSMGMSQDFEKAVSMSLLCGGMFMRTIEQMWPCLPKKGTKCQFGHPVFIIALKKKMQHVNFILRVSTVHSTKVKLLLLKLRW